MIYKASSPTQAWQSKATGHVTSGICSRYATALCCSDVLLIRWLSPDGADFHAVSSSWISRSVSARFSRLHFLSGFFCGSFVIIWIHKFVQLTVFILEKVTLQGTSSFSVLLDVIVGIYTNFAKIPDGMKCLRKHPQCWFLYFYIQVMYWSCFLCIRPFWVAGLQLQNIYEWLVLSTVSNLLSYHTDILLMVY